MARQSDGQESSDDDDEPPRTEIPTGPRRPWLSPFVAKLVERTPVVTTLPALPFGRYLLRNRIGSGGMAEIFVASPQEPAQALPELLAIKRLKDHVAATRNFLDMFVDEAHIVGRLDHPNIVRAFEYGQHEGVYYIAMELIRGMDLRRLLARLGRAGRAMPPELAAYVTEQMCLGLDHAHDLCDEAGEPLGLVHRDVTPHNVLVGFDGRVALTDFGIAKSRIQTSNTRAGVVKGKLRYMSPEQVRGRRIDRRSDVYSAGACMYEMITGRRLIESNDQRKIVAAVAAGTVEPKPSECADVPEALERILLQALARDPEKRPETAGVLAAELRAHLGGDATSAADLAEWMKTTFGNAFADDVARYGGAGRGEDRDGGGADHEGPEGSLTESDERLAHRPGTDTGTQPIADWSEIITLTGSVDTATHVYFSVVADVPPPPIERPRPEEPATRTPAPSTGHDTDKLSAASRSRSRLPLPMIAAAAVLLVGMITLGVALLALPDGHGALDVRLASDVEDGSAVVSIDGVVRGVAPVVIDDLAPGAHDVVVRAPGHRDVLARVDVEHGAPTILAIALVPLAAPAEDAPPPDERAESEPEPATATESDTAGAGRAAEEAAALRRLEAELEEERVRELARERARTVAEEATRRARQAELARHRASTSEGDEPEASAAAAIGAPVVETPARAASEALPATTPE